MKLLKAASNQMAYAKVGLLGFPGSGKTYTASEIAIELAKLSGGKPVAFVDTETGSDFLIQKFRQAGIELMVIKTRAFADVLQVFPEAEAECSVLIIDSITHVWRELCVAYQKKLNRTKLQFQDWNLIKSEWQKYTDLYINSRLHCIVCGRAGYDYDYDYNEDGSKDLIKSDIKMKVESEFGFEPSLLILMERTSENKEAVKKHLGKSDRVSKEHKALHKPVAASKWIHRAQVLKDRTDTINGQTFDYPTFEDFRPHFQALNIGGDHLGVATDRNSQELFHADHGTERRMLDNRRTIALETIQNALLKVWPGQTTAEKKGKLAMIEIVFRTLSWKDVELKPLAELELAALRLERWADEMQGSASDLPADELAGQSWAKVVMEG